MRTLLLFRGAPGCGKSTYIKEHGLSNYVLSADQIRMLCGSPIQGTDGYMEITQKNDKYVWQVLFQMLETRMMHGDFTVIDATNSKTVEMNRYKDLAKKYRYRIFIIDMTGLPIEECKLRNAERETLKRVPESVIDNMYARFATQKIPSGIKVLTPENAMDEIQFRSIDLNEYKRIVMVGDVHGCYTALSSALDFIGGIQDDTFYIFCGDYIDRGIENAQVVQFLISIMDHPNVCLLEGNHERWLYNWSHDERTHSDVFEQKTRHELEKAGIDKKQVRQLYRRLHQCAYFTYDTTDVYSPQWLVTHGGLANDRDYSSALGLLAIPTDQMIHGVGRYPDLDKVSFSWGVKTHHANQVFGHRNIQEYPIDMGHYCYDLEGKVEFGGVLRFLILEHGKDPAGYEIKNTVFAKQEEPEEIAVQDNDVTSLVNSLRKSKDVQEKSFGKISAFNFTRNAFYKGNWNDLTTKARGLFIAPDDGRVIARGYEKFFKVNEREETKIENLSNVLKFPVVAYVKENGYLGLVSYDPYTDDLFFATKGSVAGDMVDAFRKMLLEQLKSTGNDKADTLKQYLKEENLTLAFEVIDPANDPHIIEYDSAHIVLLDAIKNQVNFSKLSYDALIIISDQFNFQVKEKATEFANWQEFYAWYEAASVPDYLYHGHHIEGFVFEDSAGYMLKMKTAYYNNWKHMRSVVESVRKYGAIRYTSSLTTKEQNEFYGFLRQKYANDPNFKDRSKRYDIISLRKEFFRSCAGK